MKNAKRLIDANALKYRFKLRINWLENVKYDEYTTGIWDGCLYDAKLIDEASTVDAVEVVRCKDCAQWHRHCGRTDSPNGHCFTHDIEMNGYDFCSYGERRDNGTV